MYRFWKNAVVDLTYCWFVKWWLKNQDISGNFIAVMQVAMENFMENYLLLISCLELHWCLIECCGAHCISCFQNFTAR